MNYRYAKNKKDIIYKLMQKYLKFGIIQNSSNPYASPVVLVERNMDHGGYAWINS